MDADATVETIPVTLSLLSTPNPVDAGADFTLKAAVVCVPPLDLCATRLAIETSTGDDVGELLLTEFEEGESRGSIRMTAPSEPGPTILTVRFPANPDVGIPEDICAEIGFDIPAHASSVVVWDVPPAIEAGQSFAIHAGLRCSASCALEGRLLEVRDDQDRLLATATTGKTWQDTSALHFARITLTAPENVGNTVWRVSAPADGLEVPHSDGAMTFAVTTTLAGEHEIRVSAVDAKTNKVIADALVHAHPFRTTTDSQGNAKLSLPGGDYRIMVRASGHEPYIIEGQVKENMQITAMLAPEVDTTEMDLWA